MEYSPISFKVPSGSLMELFSISIPFSIMKSLISLVPIDPYKVPSSDTGASIFTIIDSSFLASSMAISFLLVSAFRSSSFLFSYSALFSLSALIALPEGIKKFLPYPDFTFTKSPGSPSCATFSKRINSMS